MRCRAVPALAGLLQREFHLARGKRSSAKRVTWLVVRRAHRRFYDVEYDAALRMSLDTHQLAQALKLSG